MDPTDCRELAEELRGNTTDGAARLAQRAISMLRARIAASPTADLAGHTL